MAEDQNDNDKTAAIAVVVPGSDIAQYNIIRQLGVGGMGEVYLADDKRLKRKVALKFLSPQFLSDENLKARFMREAQSAAALSHPNIVTIYEVSEVRDRVFIAMEYVQGETLRELMDKGGLTTNNLCGVATQICDGLSAAHAASLVHRDVKPANVIVDANNRVRVLDFGLAKETGDDQLTKAGMTLGTVSYMSPEQGQGQEVDHRSDIFSMGVMLYEMVTGKVPFKEANIPATLYAIVHQEPPPVKTTSPELDELLQLILQRAMAKDAKARYQGIDEMASDIRQMLGSGSLPTNTITLAAPQVQPKSLAILQLRNLGPAEDEFLSYGITEDLIIDLSRIGAIRVVPMRSVIKFKDSDLDLDEIAEKLKVDLILDGSIHKADKNVRVSAQLIDVKAGNNLWAERWEVSTDRLPRIKKALADGIGSVLNIGTTIVREAGVGVPVAKDAEAYELYLKAKYTFEHKEDVADVDIALGLYRQALRKEPSLLAARAGIAEILIYQGMTAPAEEEIASALVETEQQGRQSESVILFRLRARVRIQQSKWEEAKDFAKKALELSKEANDLDGEAVTLGTLISILQPQGKFDEALLHFDRILEISRKLEDEEKIGEALKNMGVAYSRKGDYQRALGLYEESLEIAERCKDFALQAACFSNIGNVHFFQGDLEKAFSHYGQALQINSRLGDRAGSARQNLNMGLIQLQQGNHQEGIELLESSSAFFEALGDRANQALTLANMSQIRLIMGQYDKALATAERAQAIADEIDHPLARNSAHHRLGSAYMYDRNFEKASVHMHRALEIAREHEMSRNVAALEGELAQLHYLKDDFSTAEAHAKRSQSLAREINDKPTLCLSEAYLAAISAHGGIFHANTRQLRRHLEASRKIGDAELETHIEILLGELLYAYGKDEDKTEGEQILNSVLTRSQEQGLAPETKRVTEIIQPQA